MNILENWIIELLEKPIEEFNDKYRSETIVMDELHALPLSRKQEHFVNASYVSDDVLYKLHEKIRNCSCENSIWESTVYFLVHPLPAKIAHDLIDRLIATVGMAHTRQVDEIQWRLATFLKEALNPLISERYEDERFSDDQFRKILKTYKYNNEYESILYMLESRLASSDEKEAIYLAAVEEEKGRINERQHQRDSDSSSNHPEDD